MINFLIFSLSEFRPNQFITLLMHHQLQSEHRGRLVVDLFDVLNSAVISVLL